MSITISATGLTAQRIRMNVIANNIANANSTVTAEGGPYRRRSVLFQPIDYRPTHAARSAKHAVGDGVRVVAVTEDRSERAFIRVYDPSHPQADEQGYVLRPNINTVIEMVNLVDASRAYEANVAAIQDFRRIMERTLQIGA